MSIICDKQELSTSCKYCGFLFSAKSPRTLYCSELCRNKYNYQKFKIKNPKKIATKICLNCQKSFDGGRSDRIYCSIKCGNNYRSSKWEVKNPDKVKARREKTREKSWIRFALSRVKHRAKTRGIPFNIELNDIDQPTHCCVLGIKLNYNNKGLGYKGNSPSVDRVDPKKGYIKGNVRVISWRANLLKSDASIEELEAVLLDLKKLSWGQE